MRRNGGKTFPRSAKSTYANTHRQAASRSQGSRNTGTKRILDSSRLDTFWGLRLWSNQRLQRMHHAEPMQEGHGGA